MDGVIDLPVNDDDYFSDPCFSNEEQRNTNSCTYPLGGMYVNGVKAALSKNFFHHQ